MVMLGRHAGPPGLRENGAVCCWPGVFVCVLQETSPCSSGSMPRSSADEAAQWPHEASLVLRCVRARRWREHPWVARTVPAALDEGLVGTARPGSTPGDGAGSLGALSSGAHQGGTHHHGWAWQLLLHIARWMLGRPRVVVGDGTAAGGNVWRHTSRRLRSVRVVTRWRVDARVDDPPPAGRAAERHQATHAGFASPRSHHAVADTRAVLVWGTTRDREIATGTALWEHSPLPLVAIRRVLLRDPQGQDEPLAWRCTDHDAEAARVVEWRVWRWTGDVTVPDVRPPLGVVTPPHWSDLAMLRTTPAAARTWSRSSAVLG
jgi:hypothetical protein